jgi:hypothetical protein
MKTARKQWNPAVTYTPYYRGAGLIDIPAALNSSEVVAGYAVSPAVTKNADGTMSAQDISGIWGNSVVWADSVVWCDSVVWADNLNLALKGE